MNNTIVITMGRGHGEQGLSRERWTQLGWDTVDLLADLDANILQRPRIAGGTDQVGWWDGQEEDAVTWVLLLQHTAVPELRRQLGLLAREYEQQCFGFICVEGDNHLLWAAKEN